MLSSLHPISLFTRTDAELTTLYHSFYLIEYIRDQDDTRVVQRYPHDKPQIDTIESGLKIFILQRLSYCCEDESTGKFVVTSSDSSRYFAFFRSYKDRVFVAVSSLPNMSLSRRIFDLLHSEPAEYIPSVLLLLTEIPILPGVGLQYDVKLTSGTASLKFSLAEQVEDIDVDFIVLNMLTPIILVRAWESLILERKLLVVSSSDACVIACCEFLRRIVLPLSIVSTYVPLLPLQLIDTVDAPFPYLLGANSKMLKENIFDLQDTIVIDLDTRRLIPAASSTDTDPFASVQIIAKLIQEVHDIMIEPLGEWFDRSSDDVFGASPYTADSYCLRSAKLLQIFKRTNLELMSARSCSVNAFWRRPVEPLVLHPGRYSSKTAFNVAPWRESIHGSPLMRRSNGLMMMGGFNYQDGICSGFMQLYKELQDENEQISNFLQCWVELDQYVLAVYQYADDLPILSVLVRDIQTASPVAVEPEGHVFELVIKDSMSYRFTVTDPESRQKWIATIDRRKDMDFSKTNDHDCYDVFAAATEAERSDTLRRKSSAVFESGVSPLTNGSSLLGASVVPMTTTPLKRLTSAELSGGRGVCAVFEGSAKRTWTGYEMKLHTAESSDASSHSGGTASNGASNATSANPSNGDNPNASTSGNSVSLGYPQPCPEENVDILSAMAKEDSFFRFNFSRTQMMTSLHSQLECVEYNEIFKKLNIRMEKLLSEAYVLDDRLNIHYQQSAAADGRSDSSLPDALRQSSPRLLTRTLTAGGTDNAPSRPQSIQRSRLFNGFFNKKVDTEDELEKQQLLELKREQEAELRRRKEAEEERRADLRTKIYMLTAAYRKTQPELIDLTVQNRQGALQGLVYDYISSVYAPDDDCKGEQRPKHAVLTFCVTDMLLKLKPLFDKTETPPVDPSFSICSEEATSKAHRWISHIWLGMTGKSWDQYCFEPPLSVQLQNYSEQDSNSSLVYDDEQVSTTSTTTSATISTRADQLQELIFLADQRNKQEELQKRQIRELLLAYLLSQQQEKLPDPEFNNYAVVTKALLGLMYQTLGHSKEALECYADGALVDQRRVMTCLVLQFIAQAKAQEGQGDDAADRSRANDFIEWGNRISALMGKYAYRLILELIYTNLLTALDQNNSSTDEISGMNAELELGSFRTFSGSHRSVGVANRKAARSKAQLSGTILNTDFVYVPNTDLKTEHLNSALICTSIKVERSAGDLSMLLLTELTEIMKTYCKSPVGIKNSARSTFGYSKLKINPATMEALTSTSAFKAFEQHSCILQKLELIGMHIDERVQFFVNIYNTLTVHSLMLKGSPGNSMLERSSFMRNSKYNIGGNLFSLFEIEHGILRHSSTKAMIFGPLTISVNFGEKDPRRKLVLEQSRPNISFCLFTAMVSSPALVVLKDSSTVNEDMNHHARRFLLEYVKPDPVARSICLPALLRIYWSDFGGSRYRVLKSIGAITGPEMANNLKPYMSPTEGLRAKVEFSKLDWTPIIAVCD